MKVTRIYVEKKLSHKFQTHTTGYDITLEEGDNVEEVEHVWHTRARLRCEKEIERDQK